MTTTLEQVARAIWNACEGKWFCCAWDEAGPHRQAMIRAAAGAAMRAMNAPEDAGDGNTKRWRAAEDAIATWDAILNEPVTEGEGKT